MQILPNGIRDHMMFHVKQMLLWYLLLVHQPLMLNGYFVITSNLLWVIFLLWDLLPRRFCNHMIKTKSRLKIKDGWWRSDIFSNTNKYPRPDILAVLLVSLFKKIEKNYYVADGWYLNIWLISWLRKPMDSAGLR